MVRVREIPRTATFAWSPGAQSPLIATGTRAGAVDADFSNETQLEIWNLALGDPNQAVELQPAGAVSVDSRFHDIAWSQPNDEHSRGIIAGGLESGSLDLWDAEKLRTNSGDPFLSRTSKHSGAIKALQFNPFRHGLLASAGAKGELYITDLANAAAPFRLGTSAARADDFEALDWNKKVPHILVTGSSGGFVTVWDVKAKKESLTLNNFGRKAVSAVAWNPDVPTKLATAIPNDQDPLILLWDLRNSNAPERTLRAHDQGVLSLSWCGQDSDLFLSCGKDNRTICWNPHTGETYGEFPVVTNWTFETRWNPHNPSLLATASFDGKIGVQTIQNTNAQADHSAAAANQPLDGEDFFAKAQTQPQGAAFTLHKAPKWLERPVGVSFGFGGKLVKFSPAESGSRKSKMSISTFTVDESVGTATVKFEEALQQGDLASFCKAKISESKTEEEKANWTVIETLISGNARKKLVEYLGFSDQSTNGEGADASTKSNEAPKAQDESSFFDDAGSGDNFLSDLAASKGAKTNNPFQICTGSETDADKNITRALMLGSFDEALDICLKEDRLSDAFMIAICGGQKCIDKAQAAYFRKRSGGPNYLRLLASVVGKNLWDVVYNADLSNWKEVMATLCTFADQAEFPDLCEALGDRLEEAIQGADDNSSLRKDASFCYLAGSKLEKVVVNWVQELDESEKAGLENKENDSSFSVHVQSLQNFIQKVTVFRQVTNFKDPEREQPSNWKLEPLYAKYTEYAEIAASHGQLKIAEKYLDLLPAQYPAAEVARNRVKHATRKAAPQAAQRQTSAVGTGAQRTQRTVPVSTFQPAQAPGLMTTAVPSPYSSTTASQTSNAYTPASTRSYTPVGYQPPQQPSMSQTYGGGYQTPQPSIIPPPPRGMTASPSNPPPSKATSMSNWNDLPDNFGAKPPVRRATPSMGPGMVSSPFSNQPSMTSTPPMASPFTPQQRATPPPPPKGPPQGPSRISSPASHVPHLQHDRPSSSAANAYAPPQLPQGFAAPSQQMLPRGASPYNPPPTTAPPTNRYAPTPGSQAPTLQQNASMPPPPRQVAPNPYAVPQTSSPMAPPPMSQGPPPRGPPQAPPQGPPQGFKGPPPSASTGPPPRATPESRPSTAQSQRSTSVSKYPSGDRSHIPVTSQPIFDILSADMQRIKARAPAAFKPQVNDTEKRLNILFDHLNNEDLLKPDTIQELNELVQHLQCRNFDAAQAVFTNLMTTKNDEGSNWMVGVKRLIAMSKATPPS
ncbi:hypothetical protein M501DRAFT_1015741 [Patellaria atrata CBS 101060]|uniref:Protein transport protein SEC31 n=1 Tax=Patellaria atrata CBS 101060 TaxID=1346257 RepID=A0A9P4SBM4_9PEZI|nr:hypothetical protein M501DRAFT_1015741 [Patellaria atrata CBS 101060]